MNEPRDTIMNDIIGGIKMAKHEEVKNGVIFPAGEKNEAYAQFFVGQSYLQTLIADPKVNVGVGNVTFEPGCRNNWHIHRDGFQLLLVTGGEGWYQEEGKPAQFLKAGDVIMPELHVFYEKQLSLRLEQLPQLHR